MGNKIYEIAVPNDFPASEGAFKELIKQHANYFEGHVMADYRGDARYTYQPDSFEVTEVYYEIGDDAGSIEFEVDVQYFEGCKDRDGVDQQPRIVEFSVDKIKRCLVFELNEDVWNTDN